MLSLAALPQDFPEGQGKRGEGVLMLVWLCCSPGKGQEVFRREPSSQPGCPHAHMRWESTGSTQKKKIHQTQAEAAEWWMAGSTGHTLGKETRNKPFLPTVLVPCN